MIACFPVAASRGLDSEVYGHFGSAPAFVLCDTDSAEVSELPNADLGHSHGACSPIKALSGAKVDCVVVGGIGAGALGKLGSLGIKVYRAGGLTVRENLALLAEGTLKPMSQLMVCGGHGAGGNCHH